MALILEKQKRRMVMTSRKYNSFFIALLIILFPFLRLHLLFPKTQRQPPLVVPVLTAMVQGREMMKLFMPQIIRRKTTLRIVRNVVRQVLHTLMFTIRVRPALEKVM